MAVNMGSAIAYLELDTSKFTKGFTSAYNDLKVFGDKTATAEQKLSGLSSAFKTAGGVLSKNVTLPLVGVGAAAVNSGIKWESAWTGVTKTVDGTKKQMKELEKGLLDISKRTSSSATDIASVAEAAGQLGIQTENVLDFTETMVKLGDTTNLTAEEAATTFARFANIVGMSQNDFDKLGSTIVDLGNNFATTEREISEMALRLAGAGKQVGLTESQILGFSTALSSVGIEAEAGGTAFSKVFSEIQLAVETNSESLNQWSEIAGMSAEEFKIAFEKDAAGAILAFIEGLGKSEEKGKSAIAVLSEMGIEEVRLRDALLRASGASDVFRESLKVANNAWRENTALSEEARKRYETTEAKIQQLKNRLLEVGITISDTLLPYFESFVGLLEKLIEKFNSLDEETQNNIVKFGLFLAAIGPVMLILSKLFSVVSIGVNIFKTLKSGINLARNSFTLLNAGITSLPKSLALLGKAFGLLTNPITLIITIVVALIGVFVYLWNTNEEFKNKVIEIWETIKESISNVVQGIITFFTETIPTAFNTFVSETLPNIINAIVTWFEQLPYRIGFAIGQIVGYIVNMGVSIWEWITIELPLIIEGIVQWFAQLPSRIGEWLQNVISKVIAWGSDLISKGKQTAQEFVQNFVSFMRELPGKIKNIIDEIPNKIKSVGSKLKQAGKDIFNKLLDGIKSVASEITDFVQGIADTIGNIISGIIDGFNSVVSGADKARSAARSVDGKHANGLDYVPYNGYIAELHEGERVLTKQQNRDYNRGRTGQGGDTFNFYNTKPTPYEYARQMKKAKRELLYDF